MKYTLQYNQRAIVEHFKDSGLKPIDFLLIDFIGYWATLDCAEKKYQDGRMWFWLKWTVIRDQNPTLELNTYNSVRNHILKLCSSGLLVAHPDNQNKGQAMFAMGEKWALYNGKAQEKTNVSTLPTNVSTLPTNVSTPYQQTLVPPTNSRVDNNTTEYNTTNDKEEQVFAREQNFEQPQTAFVMSQAFAEAMRLEMQTRADGLASYQNSIYRGAADTFLEKCVLNIAAAAQTCYRHESAKINLTTKVAQAYGCLLFNRFEALCENGNGTSRFLHTQTTFQQTLMQLSQYCEAFICDVLSEATMGGWETPKTDAAILADKYNKWLYTHRQTENLTKVRQQVESADKAAKNAFSVAIGVLEDKEIDMVNKAAKASKVNKRSDNGQLKAAARRAYAAVMYMRTKDAIYNSSVDANGVPMGLEAERTGDAVYTAAYEIIKGNYQSW